MSRLHAPTTHRPLPIPSVRPSAASSIACTCGGVASVRTNGLGQCYTECDACHRVQVIPRVHLPKATRWAQPVAPPYEAPLPPAIAHKRRPRKVTEPKVCVICETVFERAPKTGFKLWAQQTTCGRACARALRRQRMLTFNAERRRGKPA